MSVGKKKKDKIITGLELAARSGADLKIGDWGKLAGNIPATVASLTAGLAEIRGKNVTGEWEKEDKRQKIKKFCFCEGVYDRGNLLIEKSMIFLFTENII